MSRQAPGDGVSNPQGLLHLHGQMEGVNMQWATLHSFTLLDLFNFYDLFLKTAKK